MYEILNLDTDETIATVATLELACSIAETTLKLAALSIGEDDATIEFESECDEDPSECCSIHLFNADREALASLLISPV